VRAGGPPARPTAAPRAARRRAGPAERLFLWIDGFRPSDLVGTLAPQLGPLAEPQGAAVRALQRTAHQLEDALAQGLDKQQQTLA
jgi:transcription factor TGA